MSVLALDSVGLRDGMADRTFCVFSSVGDGRDSADIWPSRTRSAAGRSGNWPVVSGTIPLRLEVDIKKKQYPKVNGYLRRLSHCAVAALSLRG